MSGSSNFPTVPAIIAVFLLIILFSISNRGDLPNEDEISKAAELFNTNAGLDVRIVEQLESKYGKIIYWERDRRSYVSRHRADTAVGMRVVAWNPRMDPRSGVIKLRIISISND